MMPLVFVVDSFAERRNAIHCALEHAGHRVEIFATTHALDAAEQNNPDVMVIAANLADGSGIHLCRRIRELPALSHTALVLLSHSEPPSVRVLDNSCADVLVGAPEVPGEVVAAVETALERRCLDQDFMGKCDVVINSSAMRVAVRGKEISTTTLEFRLIDYMARHHGKVFSRDALLDAVWGDLQFVTPRSVDACVSRIRRKIEPLASQPTFLKSVRGIGYKLDASPAWESEGDLCRCATCSTIRTRIGSSSERAMSERAMSARLSS